MEETRNVWENEELLNIVTVGHVDHGKSTVIGRLLADAGALPKGKLESIRENCRRNSKPFEYAFLLDALHNEQDQGITIDTARCFFKSDKRRYIIIDAPGHIEFLKNMVTGASRAEAALMVIDAARGVEENTRRHGYFLSMLGIRQVAVLVNKMDLVGYSEEVYRSIVTEFTEFLAKINISPAAFIPVSGMEGDNIAIRSERTPWYFGPTVLDQMDAFVPVPSPENRPLRMPVQGVYKFTEGGDERRIVAGTLEAGSLRAGDKIVFYPSGKKTTVASLEVFSAPTPEKFIAGDAAGFTMTEQIFVRRGEIACLESEEAPFVGVRLRANVFWLAASRQALFLQVRHCQGGSAAREHSPRRGRLGAGQSGAQRGAEKRSRRGDPPARPPDGVRHRRLRLRRHAPVRYRGRLRDRGRRHRH